MNKNETILKLIEPSFGCWTCFWVVFVMCFSGFTSANVSTAEIDVRGIFAQSFPSQGEEELTESQKAEREALQKEADVAGHRFLHMSVVGCWFICDFYGNFD